MISIPLLINNIVEDEERNNLISSYIIKLYDESIDNNIYIFSDRREHLKSLANNLTNNRSDIKVLIGGCNEDDIKDAVNNCRVIYTTYQFCGTGVNIQKMNSLVLATPRKNGFIQFLGRILRRGSDINIIRKIIDIVDIKSILYNQFAERKKIYIQNDFKIININ